MRLENLHEIQEKEMFPGYHGELFHGEQLSWAFWRVDEGSAVPEHHHIHEQMMHVISGRFEFTLNGITKICEAGDIIHIPSNQVHSGKALTDCVLMDVFSPARDDYK